jgi:hypothetical protein
LRDGQLKVSSSSVDASGLLPNAHDAIFHSCGFDRPARI